MGLIAILYHAPPVQKNLDLQPYIEGRAGGGSIWKRKNHSVKLSFGAYYFHFSAKLLQLLQLLQQHLLFPVR